MVGLLLVLAGGLLIGGWFVQVYQDIGLVLVTLSSVILSTIGLVELLR